MSRELLTKYAKQYGLSVIRNTTFSGYEVYRVIGLINTKFELKKFLSDDDIENASNREMLIDCFMKDIKAEFDYELNK